MPDFLEKAAAQVPALAVLSAIVWLFLKEMRACSDARERVEERYSAMLEKTTEAITRNTDILQDAHSTIRDLNSEIRRATVSFKLKKAAPGGEPGAATEREEG